MKHLELDANLSDNARAIQETAIKFAAEVMRPVGKALDVLITDCSSGNCTRDPSLLRGRNRYPADNSYNKNFSV